MPNYPVSKDDATSLPNPTGASKQNNPDHGALHTAENAAIIALESKLGTGATTPASNTLLLGTGTGTSAWSQATSAQLAASISDETGSGSAVFANTPTLLTPKVDTINESTLNNGVTVGGVNLKAGTITTASSVSSTAIANAAVTPSKLNTGAQGGYVATSEVVNSPSAFIDAPTAGPSVTVTIGANGLALVFINAGIAAPSGGYAGIGVVISGANTIAASDDRALFNTFTGNQRYSASLLYTGLTAGATTFKLVYKGSTVAATFIDRRIAVVPL